MGYTAPTGQISAYKVKGTNPLDDYASYSCHFTLAALTKEQQAARVISPSSITNIIASTKGDWGGGGKKRVVTDFGSFDYFIDDVLIVSIPSMTQQTGNSFATKISFKVTEPYSMALFFLTLQLGAKASGYDNYREAPFLLMIEFIGYNDSGTPIVNPSLTRYIPIKLIRSKMKVTGAGTTYDCDAIPYNEILFRDEISSIKKDHTLRGSNVKEILTGSGSESLASVLKKQFQEDVSDKIMDVSDQIEIHFPKTFTDTGDSGNEISNSDIFKDFTDGGSVKFPNQDEVYNSIGQIYNNKQIKLDKDRNFHFEPNMKIQEVITEVILRSDYITKQLTNSKVLNDSRGMIKWFRVEANIFDGPFSKKLNRQTRKMVYRVIPYMVHLSKLIPPNVIPPGYDEIKKTVLRVYDYIYTGKNTEILNLELDFNVSFFSELPADAGRRTGQNAPNLTGNASGGDPVSNINTGGAKVNSTEQLTTQTSADSKSALKKTGGSSGTEDVKSIQVRTLQSLLESPADLVRITMTVMGDPYYLPTSGMGNIIVPPKGENELTDGSMNYQNGEVDITVNFRTPVDLDPVTGLYRFIKTADQFSGLYMIIRVESKFNQNKFTQTITANKRLAQLSGSPQSEIALG
jgi:hypothetical protein